MTILVPGVHCSIPPHTPQTVNMQALSVVLDNIVPYQALVKTTNCSTCGRCLGGWYYMKVVRQLSKTSFADCAGHLEPSCWFLLSFLPSHPSVPSLLLHSHLGLASGHSLLLYPLKICGAKSFLLQTSPSWKTLWFEWLSLPLPACLGVRKTEFIHLCS